MPQTIGLNLIARLVRDARLPDFYRLRREYFTDAEELRAYDVIAAHVETHGILPSLEALQRHRVEIDEPDSADPYGVWYDEYTNRALYNRFSDLLIHVQEDLAETRARDALDRVMTFVEETHTIRSDGQQELRQLADLGPEVIQTAVDRRRNLGMSGIPTGWVTLDRVTHGYQPGDLIVISARPGVGKTTALLHSAMTAHSHNNIPLFLSMEMPLAQIAMRLLAMRANLNLATMQGGELTHYGQVRLATNVEQLAVQQPFYMIEGQFRKNVNDLSALVHALCPNILFVDGGYLLKLASANSRMPLWEKIGEIAQTLKNIAIVRHIPVIVTFQINREGAKRDRSGKEMGVEHLQLSDAIGQLASVIIAMYEDMDTDSLDAPTRRRFHILKGRSGERGTWYINWNFAPCDFSEIVEQHDEPEPEVEYDDD